MAEQASTKKRVSLLERVIGGGGGGKQIKHQKNQQPQPHAQQQPMSDEAKSYGLYAYGSSYLESRDYGRALQCYNHALVLQRSALGWDHEITGRTLRQVGTCLMKMDTDEVRFAALTALEEALCIRQLNYGEGDPGAAEIANDIWMLLHSKRLELEGTPDRIDLLRDMKRQMSRKELQSFVFQSVRRRGGLWSANSVRNMDTADATVAAASSNDLSSPSSSRSSSNDNDRDHRDDELHEAPIADVADDNDTSSAVMAETPPAILPTTAAAMPPQHRRRGNQIGLAPAMGRIGEDSIASLHDASLSKLHDLNLEENDDSHNLEDGNDRDQDGDGCRYRERGSGDDDDGKPNMAPQYTGVSFRDIGDLGGQWAREADESCEGPLLGSCSNKCDPTEARDWLDKGTAARGAAADAALPPVSLPRDGRVLWGGNKAA